MQRIAQLEAALREKEAIIDALSSASEASAAAAQAEAQRTEAMTAREREELGLAGDETIASDLEIVPRRSAAQAEGDGKEEPGDLKTNDSSSSFLTLDGAEALSKPRAPTPTRPPKSSLREAESPKATSAPLAGSAPLSNGVSDATAAALLANRNSKARQSATPPSAYTDRSDAQIAQQQRRASGLSLPLAEPTHAQGSTTPIVVEPPNRRSSLTLVRNGNRAGLQVPTDYSSDTESSTTLGLTQSSEAAASRTSLISNNSSTLSRKGSTSGTWASRFRKSASAQGEPHSASPTDGNKTFVPEVSGSKGGALGNAWKRSSIMGRKRKTGGSLSVDLGQTPIGGRLSPSHLDPAAGNLAPLREAGARSPKLPAPPEDFAAPTIASENRRLANLTQQANHALAASNAANLPHSSLAATQSNGHTATPSAGGNTTKVIMALTNELQATKNLLDNTRSALRASQKSTSAAQRGLDDTKEALGRSRLENENTTRMLERKERQLQESLERARKAEADSKDLGRQSREWGTRVREVEAELGEARREKAKCEAQYEAIRGAWEGTRAKWRLEVDELRKEVQERDKKREHEVAQMKSKMEQMDKLWAARAQEKEALEGVLTRLQEEKGNIAAMLQEQVGPLSKQADYLEQEETRLAGTVDSMHSELKRILRLARAGQTEAA